MLTVWLKVVNTPTYKDKPVESAVQRYLHYLANHGEEDYGVMENTITTGMVGIALADAIEFGISF